MSVDLNAYEQISCALLVRIKVDKWRAGPNDAFTQMIYRFSDSPYPVTLTYDTGDETFISVGTLLDVSASKSELRNSSSQVTITLAGIPNSGIAEVLNSRIKGSRVEIWRVIMQDGQPVDIPGNPVGRFFGFISNYTVDESWGDDTTVSTINFICTSHLEGLTQRIQGRRTNPYDQKLFYPEDVSMDRVPNLIDANYEFGYPTK